MRTRIGGTVAAAMLLAIAYGRLPENGFVDLDDQSFILENPTIRSSLTLHTIADAFAPGKTPPYWQPLTTLSLAVDHAIFGFSPSAFHIESLFWHAAAALVLFMALRAATSRELPSCIVAVLFAIHPIATEAVAWAVERRTVLAGFFAFSCLYFHVRWAREQRPRWYGLSLGAGIIGLLCKLLVLPLPLLLLAVDVWPLRRALSWRLVAEKVPLAVVGLGASLLVAQTLPPDSGDPSLLLRLAVALSAPIGQLSNVLLPRSLSVYYPYPASVSAWVTMGAAAATLALTVLCLVLRLRAPALLFGWLWFLAALAPTLGLRQSGAWPAYADRHAYLAVVGLYVALSWPICGLMRLRPRVLESAFLVLGLGLSLITRFQVERWHDSILLLKNAAAQSPDSDYVQYSLGTAFLNSARFPEAIAHLRRATQLNPNYVRAHANLGGALVKTGQFEEADLSLRRALELDPNHAPAHVNLGHIELVARGNLSAAAFHFQRAVVLDPRFSPAYAGLGLALNQLGRFSDTVAALAPAASLINDEPSALLNLAVALIATGREPEARQILTRLEQLSTVHAQELQRVLAQPPNGEPVPRPR